MNALHAVKDGERITRTLPGDAATFSVALQSGQLTIRLQDGSDHLWVISETDLFARDWIVVKPVSDSFVEVEDDADNLHMDLAAES